MAWGDQGTMYLGTSNSMLVKGSDIPAHMRDKYNYYMDINGYSYYYPKQEAPAPPPPAPPPPAQPAQPSAPPVQQVKPPTNTLDTALLERLEEKIMGDKLSRSSNALRERQNLMGVFHSTPASQNEQRLADSARDEFQAGQMSLMADDSSREMRRLQQMQNTLSQSVSNANQQYKSQYNNYLNQNAQYNQQQDAYGKLASNNPWGGGW